MSRLSFLQARDLLGRLLALRPSERPDALRVLAVLRRDAPDVYRAALTLVGGLSPDAAVATLSLFLPVKPADKAWLRELAGALILYAKTAAPVETSPSPDTTSPDIQSNPDKHSA